MGTEICSVDGIVAEIAQRLERAGVIEAPADARRIVQAALGLSREAIARGDAVCLSARSRNLLYDFAARRMRHEPIAYLRGEVEFFGLRIEVNHDTLIPRPETELLVEAALEAVEPGGSPRIVDVCTGSGCVLAAVAVNRPSAKCFGCDLSAEALVLAARNIRNLGLANAWIFRGDMMSALRPGSVDLITANPPYVPSQEIDHLQPEIRLHEPRLALDGGTDGLKALRMLAKQASEVLVPGGMLGVEIGSGQHPQALKILHDCGFSSTCMLRDLAGTVRVLTARKRYLGLS